MTRRDTVSRGEASASERVSHEAMSAW